MRVRDRVGVALLTLLALPASESRLCAEQPARQPSPGHTQVPIWPGTAPDAGRVADAEATEVVARPVADRPWVKVRAVSRPTMTV
jgi:hypothetical protein